MEDKDLMQACQAPPEQEKYANILFMGSWLAIFVMLATYALYVSGLVTPHVPLEKVPEYWSQPVHEYVEQAEAPIGWGWVTLLGKGDFMNFSGIALLAFMTILCFLATLLPAYLKNKDWVYATIVLLEVVVLGLAASGIFGSGGH